MNAVSFPTAVAHALIEVLDADDAALLITEGAGVVADALAARFPERVLALPIADRAALAVAVGLAWGGKRPIVEVAATGRLPALAEVLAEAAQSPEGFAVPLVVRVPWGGEAGRVDGAVLDLLASIVGLAVVCPRDAGHVSGLLRSALRAGSPVIVLEPRALARSSATDAVDVALDRIEVVRCGADVTLVAFGPAVDAATAAADALADHGVAATVVDLVSLAPIDVAGLGEAVASTGRLVVVAPPVEAAFAARVVAAATEAAFWSLETKPVIVAPSVGAIVAAALAACQD